MSGPGGGVPLRWKSELEGALEKTPLITGRMKKKKKNKVPFCHTSPPPSLNQTLDDESGDPKDMATTPDREGPQTPDKPQNPDAAPNFSLSDS